MPFNKLSISSLEGKFNFEGMDSRHIEHRKIAEEMAGTTPDPARLSFNPHIDHIILL
jgi:hypothetical protein